MAETIDGALIAVRADLGASRPPFVLDRDLLDAPTSLLTPTLEALTDITASVIALDASWGATDPEGPLTLAQAGGCTLEVWDPDRAYDPANKTLADPPTPGRVVVWSVDGRTIQTVKTSAIAHELAAGVSVIDCIDALAEASRQGVIVQLAPNSTDIQSEHLAAVAGAEWGVRVVQEGAFVTKRAQDLFEGNLLEGLQRLAQAELGPVFARPDGGITIRGRGTLLEPDPVMVVAMEPGVPATNLATAVNRDTINAVYLDPIDQASLMLVYRDEVAVSLMNGEVSAEVAAADLLLAP